MKTCFKCGEKKSTSEFYRHKRMADGHLNKCKECTKRDVRLHRRESERPREYDRIRSKTEKRRKHLSDTAAAWRKKNPERYKAQYTLTNAVRDGKLFRQPCEVCGDERSHGHHDDYSKPLDVRWLCAMHHHRHHAKGRRE